MNEFSGTVPGQISLLDYLETLEGIEQEIAIKGAINTKVALKELDVRLSYGDLVLIVSMLRDYVKGLDVIKGENDIHWQAYYRKKFMDMSEKISSQIGYDYDAALEKCIKKQKKEGDIGEDALILSLKKSIRESERASEQARKKEESKNGTENI